MQEWYCEDCVARIRKEEEEEAKEADQDVQMEEPINDIFGLELDDKEVNDNQAIKAKNESGSEDDQSSSSSSSEEEYDEN